MLGDSSVMHHSNDVAVGEVSYLSLLLDLPSLFILQFSATTTKYMVAYFSVFLGERKLHEVPGPAVLVREWKTLSIHYQVARPLGQQLHLRPAGILPTTGAGQKSCHTKFCTNFRRGEWLLSVLLRYLVFCE